MIYLCYSCNIIKKSKYGIKIETKNRKKKFGCMKKMSGKFSSEDDEILIELVRKNPALYSVKSMTYKNMVIKNNIWKEIAKTLGKKERDCQIRWKSIRDYYQRKKKEIVMKGKGIQSVPNPDTFFTKFKHLSFLDNNTIERETIINVQDAENLSNIETDRILYAESNEVTNDIKVEEYPLVTEIKLINESNFIKDENIPTSSKKRKRKTISEDVLIEKIKKNRLERKQIISKTLSTQTNCEEDDAINLFFKSMAVTVSTFYPQLQARAKFEVMKIISQLEFENLNLSTVLHDYPSVSISNDTDASRSSTPV
ncbi:hypothetical protein O3M35_002016 [Rhynocoris fuscipes]|uniref:Transcription factor Adf-1 n=1 Tax=Rhynocoris fuscipes TaxID=488301 RepID=A0AAW1CR84_9HEMI